MKKSIVALVFSLCALCWILSTAHAYYGRFGDTANARDSLYMNAAVFDTLGYQLDADTVVFTRWFGGTLIDSTILTSGSTRPGYYVVQTKAFDGTHYGQYNVDVRWRVQGKVFHKAESYTVDHDSVTRVGRIQTNQDKTNYQLASGQVIARADSVTGVGRIQTNQDKTNYQLASGQVIARADSVTGVGRIQTNQDKVNYGLSAQALANVWIEDTTSLNTGPMKILKMLAAALGVGNFVQLYWYNGSEKLDSTRTKEAAILKQRQRYYRPAATSAPDSAYFYGY